MHSSGMRTARLLPVSVSMHCSGSVPIGGCTCPGGVYLVLGVYLVPVRVYLVPVRVYLVPVRVYLVPGGVPAWGVPGPGGVPAQGVYLPRGYLPRYSPPWTEFLTHTFENITLPQTSFAGGKNGMKPRNK